MPGLFDPIQVKGITLKNRILFPPIAQDMCPSGEVSEKSIRHYERMAEAGPSLVVVEHAFVDEGGRYSRRQMGIHDDGMILGLERLASAIKKKGALAGIQLAHAGPRQKDFPERAVGPSGIPISASDPIPSPLALEAIERLVSLFAVAGKRAMTAGFDMVEIHAAHGFLLYSFLSPITNRREDAYGGSTENRARILREVVEAVKEAAPSVPISVRLGSDDMMEGGMVPEEAGRIAAILEKAGADMVSVSGGLCGSRPAHLEGRQGFFVPSATIVRKHLSIPVVGVGGITDPMAADSFIRRNDVDMVAVGRELIRNPKWISEAREKLC